MRCVLAMRGVMFRFRYGDGKLVCGMQHDGLWDPYNNHHMGLCAEKCSAGK